MQKEKRVYIVGSLRGSSRARILLDYIASSPQYSFFYEDSHYFKVMGKNLFKKALFLPLRFIHTLNRFWHLLMSDIVYILPMGKISLFEIQFAHKCSKKIVYEFYISQYDTYVNDKQRVNEKSAKAKQLLKMDQYLVDNSTDIVFLNKSEQAYYSEVINREKIAAQTYTIPLATETKEKASLPFVHEQTKKVTLCWWGSYIPLHGLSKIIEAAHFLKKENVNFELFLFGTSDKKAEPYQKMIDELELTQHVFIDNNKSFSDKSLEQFLLQRCDMAFGNFGDSKKAKVVMVNKAVEAISMNIPVVSQPTQALEEFFTDKQDIYFCGSNPKDIADVIMEAIADKQKLLECSSSAYELFKQNFSREAYISKINTILNSEEGKN